MTPLSISASTAWSLRRPNDLQASFLWLLVNPTISNLAPTTDQLTKKKTFVSTIRPVHQTQDPTSTSHVFVDHNYNLCEIPTAFKLTSSTSTSTLTIFVAAQWSLYQLHDHCINPSTCASISSNCASTPSSTLWLASPPLPKSHQPLRQPLETPSTMRSLSQPHDHCLKHNLCVGPMISASTLRPHTAGASALDDLSVNSTTSESILRSLCQL